MFLNTVVMEIKTFFILGMADFSSWCFWGIKKIVSVKFCGINPFIEQSLVKKDMS